MTDHEYEGAKGAAEPRPNFFAQQDSEEEEREQVRRGSELQAGFVQRRGESEVYRRGEEGVHRRTAKSEVHQQSLEEEREDRRLIPETSHRRASDLDAIQRPRTQEGPIHRRGGNLHLVQQSSEPTDQFNDGLHQQSGDDITIDLERTQSTDTQPAEFRAYASQQHTHQQQQVQQQLGRQPVAQQILRRHNQSSAGSTTTVFGQVGGARRHAATSSIYDDDHHQQVHRLSTISARVGHAPLAQASQPLPSTVIDWPPPGSRRTSVVFSRRPTSANLTGQGPSTVPMRPTSGSQLEMGDRTSSKLTLDEELYDILFAFG